LIPGREYFWSIDHPELFYLFALAALVSFGRGVWLKIRPWLAAPRGLRPLEPARTAVILLRDGLLGARIFKTGPGSGLLHLLLLWGFLGLFLGTVLISADHYLFRFLFGPTYLLFSWSMEVLGLMLLAGVVWALARRYLAGEARLERDRAGLLVPAWLGLAGLSGFLVEGGRLAGLSPPGGGWSFAGGLVARLWASPEAAQGAYPFLWWGHALISLGLIAGLPFTRLFHALAAPVSLALQGQFLDRALDRALERAQGPAEGDEEERAGEAGGLDLLELVHLEACTRCGRCQEVCPAALAGEPLSPRTFLQALKAEREGLPEGGWCCTTCRACLQVCPVAAAPLGLVRTVRSRIVEEGASVPPRLMEGLERLYKYDNPWLAKKGGKTAWTRGLPFPVPDRPLEEEGEWLFFVGCTTGLETRAQGLARALALILHDRGVPFSTLGKREPCCGDVARQVGEVGLWEVQREQTLDLLEKGGLGNLVCSSPHCLDSFRKVYPGTLGGRDLKAVHYSQLLARLVDQGRLEFKEGLDLKLTFHDPCYLARHNRIVEEPRRVLRAIPGVELREMADSGLKTLCCGGGGGRMWHEPEGQASPGLAQRRLAQAAEAGAEAVVTACPLCLIMLEDARKTGGFEERLKVVDLAELAARALGLDIEEDKEGGG